MSYQYIDVFKAAGSPEKLKKFVNFEHVWPKETLERHAEVLKLYDEMHSKYRKHNQILREDLDKWKLNRLQIIVKFAYNNFNFYKNLYDNLGFKPEDLKSLEDFNKIPIIEKSDLQKLYSEAIQHPWVKVNHKSRTSGSTGVPLSVINDVDAHRHWFVQRLQMFEHMMQEELKPEDWIYSIYHEPFLLSSIFGEYKTFTVGLGANYEDLVEHIRKIKPKVITGIASHVIKIAKMLPDAKEIGIKLFTTNSETSSSYVRKELSKKIGVPILDEYSSEEFNIVAWEDRDGSYVVAEDNVHVELIKNGEDIATIIGTDLWNFSMPRIRYSQNDYSAWKDENPFVGFKRLERIIGRKDMTLISPEYGEIDPGIIMEIFDTTLILEESGIDEFSLVQKSLKDVKLLIKYNEKTEETKKILFEFEQRFYNVFGKEVTLSIDIEDKFPNLGLKKRCIVREFSV